MSITKRILSLFLLLVIAGPAFGFTLHSHHCCGELQGLSLLDIEPCCEASTDVFDASDGNDSFSKYPCCDDNFNRFVTDEASVLQSVNADLLLPAFDFNFTDLTLGLLSFEAAELELDLPPPPLLKTSTFSLAFTGIFRI